MKTLLAKFSVKKLFAKIGLTEWLMKFGLSEVAALKWASWALLPWPIMIGLLGWWGYRAWKNKRQKDDLGEVSQTSTNVSLSEENEDSKSSELKLNLETD